MLLMATLLSAANTTTTTVAKKSSGGGSILDPIAKPVAYVLEQCYSLVPNYAVAILMLSVLWMILISPLTLKTTRSMLAMQKLQPEIKKLQAEHKNDRQALSQAQMELFKREGVSPFGACLPTILPLPVFFALFRVIDGLSHFHGTTPSPKYLSHTSQMYHDIVAAHGHLNAFGLDLSKNALSHHSSFGNALPYYILLLVMMGTQYLQTAQMMSRNPQNQQNAQAQMMKFLPLIFGVFCIRFPAGVVLYYAMSNICRMAQQTLMYRFDPKVKALAAREVDEIEAITRDIDEKGADHQAPPPKTKFRDLLRDATEQARSQQPERQTNKPGGSTARSAPKGRPTPARGAANKAAKKADGKKPSTAGSGSAGGKKSGPTPVSGAPRALFGKNRDASTSSSAPASGGGQKASPRGLFGKNRPDAAEGGEAWPVKNAGAAGSAGSAGSTADKPKPAKGAKASPAKAAPGGKKNGSTGTGSETGSSNGRAQGNQTDAPANGTPKPAGTGAGRGRTGGRTGAGSSAARSNRKRRGR